MRRFPAADAEAFRQLARSWAATVTVVTAKQRPGAILQGFAEIDGFTATGFLTVSLEPPVILISCMNEGSSLAMLREAQGFAVNLLAPQQDALAAEFARPQPERPHLWNDLPWVPDAQGAPLLGGTVGAFSARLRQLVPAGDHTLVLGDVTAIHLDKPEGETLVYHNRGYGRFSRAKT
jgi:flavin reductase (DIM6/NTAB) family NADH-FMN oxidoreductase RutF